LGTALMPVDRMSREAAQTAERVRAMAIGFVSEERYNGSVMPLGDVCGVGVLERGVRRRLTFQCL
jgi:hypothetical protein